MEKTNYMDWKSAKEVDYSKNQARDDSGGAEHVSKSAMFGDGGKITAAKGILGSGD